MQAGKIAQYAIGAFAVLYLYNYFSSDIAEMVYADEITGTVLEHGTGKPVPNAIVALRFARYNTGHSANEACFRSMATESDANGRFRFPAWQQAKTQANYFTGEAIAYKKGFALAQFRTTEKYLEPDRRSLLGIRWSGNLHLSKHELKLELKEWTGTDEERIGIFEKVAEDLVCIVNELPVRNKLFQAFRTEIAVSPFSNVRTNGSWRTPLDWIDDLINQFR
jgi:hypothetical protein